jgi:hypothetical protein
LAQAVRRFPYLDEEQRSLAAGTRRDIDLERLIQLALARDDAASHIRRFGGCSCGGRRAPRCRHKRRHRPNFRTRSARRKSSPPHHSKGGQMDDSETQMFLYADPGRDAWRRVAMRRGRHLRAPTHRRSPADGRGRGRSGRTGRPARPFLEGFAYTEARAGGPTPSDG